MPEPTRADQGDPVAKAMDRCIAALRAPTLLQAHFEINEAKNALSRLRKFTPGERTERLTMITYVVEPSEP